MSFARAHNRPPQEVKTGPVGAPRTLEDAAREWVDRTLGPGGIEYDQQSRMLIGTKNRIPEVAIHNIGTGTNASALRDAIVEEVRRRQVVR